MYGWLSDKITSTKKKRITHTSNRNEYTELKYWNKQNLRFRKKNSDLVLFYTTQTWTQALLNPILQFLRRNICNVSRRYKLTETSTRYSCTSRSARKMQPDSRNAHLSLKIDNWNKQQGIKFSVAKRKNTIQANTRYSLNYFYLNSTFAL